VIKVPLQTGLGTFEVNVSEFVQGLRAFVGVSLNKPARKALKTMIEEVDKDFELVTDVLTPLFAFNTASDFEQGWKPIFTRFKKHYLTRWHVLTTHCGIVSDQLKRMQKAHDWKRRVPFLRDAVTRLEDMGQRWMANDKKLHEAMSSFLTSVDQALTAVNKLHGTPAKAVARLQSVLHGSEKSLLTIRAYANELKRLSARL